MSDAFESYQDRIREYREKLTYVEGASGIAVAIGDRILSVDLFDKPTTCEKVWDRLLSGVFFDALEASQSDTHVSVAQVEQLVGSTNDLPWEPSDAVGEGEEYRAESTRGDYATALSLDDTVVHGSLITAI